MSWPGSSRSCSTRSWCGCSARGPPPGLAVTIVTALALVLFAVLAYSFGNPLVNGITDLTKDLPVLRGQGGARPGLDRPPRDQVPRPGLGAEERAQAGHYAESLSKPVLTVGKGALSLVIELFTIFVLVLLLLLEGPKMRRGCWATWHRPGRPGSPGWRAK